MLYIYISLIYIAASMPPRLPQELRDRALILFDLGWTTHTIAKDLNVSIRQIYKWKSNLELFGTLTPPPLSVIGRPRTLTTAQEDALLQYIEECPTVYQDEMSWFIYDEFELSISEASICRILKRRKWSRKAAKRRALQRSQLLRDEYMARLSQWEAQQLVFIDESACCERNGHRKYGWAPIGHIAAVDCELKRSRRWSILPAFTTMGYISWKVVHGSITSAIFNDWVANEVIPQCGRYSQGEACSVLIMDNARIHHSEVTSWIKALDKQLLIHMPRNLLLYARRLMSYSFIYLLTPLITTQLRRLLPCLRNGYNDITRH
jgi:transposase